MLPRFSTLAALAALGCVGSQAKQLYSCAKLKQANQDLRNRVRELCEAKDGFIIAEQIRGNVFALHPGTGLGELDALRDDSVRAQEHYKQVKQETSSFVESEKSKSTAATKPFFTSPLGKERIKLQDQNNGLLVQLDNICSLGDALIEAEKNSNDQKLANLKSKK